ncbi:hypothetical protein D623_10020283 [Myotis brandtii]|uniref:Uncharacterized protein n=1 Tax=Myotis brandtii TaxID=109478 RepID=S7Q0H8_MYOBR|nr:hypothetical protein D623_10020283 [Myotis brandtii]
MDHVAPEGKLAEKKSESMSSHPSKRQSQRGGRIPFQDELKPPQGGWATLRAPGRPPWPWRGTCTRPFDSLENHFRGEEVKRIKKMGDT